MSLGITRLGQIAIPVHDLDRAIVFYRDTLGLPFVIYRFRDSERNVLALMSEVPHRKQTSP